MIYIYIYTSCIYPLMSHFYCTAFWCVCLCVFRSMFVSLCVCVCVCVERVFVCCRAVFMAFQVLGCVSKCCLDPVSWIQEHGLRILYPASWSQDAKSRNLDMGFKMQTAGLRIQNPGSRVLSPGSWILDLARMWDSGCGIQDVGSLILDPDSRMVDSGSRIQDAVIC